MPLDRWQQINKIFFEAVKLDPSERSSLVDRACGDDSELRAEVEKLLAHDTERDASTRGDSVPVVMPLSPLEEEATSLPSIPDFEIRRRIQGGGQGVVYQAVHKITKRKVAIKVMREGPFASRSERARFDREVEVLGHLNHPNIVTIHHTGQVSGSFYFVMDYISGQALDDWMTVPNRTIEETLQLFAKICEAVNAAHLKGVIHRDLKPGNIRVDNNGEPHILDFGLAKVATSSDALAMTVTGQFIGSLPWAAPEQAEGAPGKIDLRTDVYQLGIILYQMLTGRFPYDVVGNMPDVLGRIMRTEPVRPSTIIRQINDEVETIVLKCLAKERERRYQSAGELARDIRHYLAGEPIEAIRDSAWYQIKKHLQRHKLPVIIGSAFLTFGTGLGLFLRTPVAVGVVALSVAVVFAGFVWGMYRREASLREIADEERRRAEAARLEAEEARLREGEQRERAERQARAAELERHRAAFEVYVTCISTAQAASAVGDLTTLQQCLNDAPDDFRGWEWLYLLAKRDESMSVLRGHDDTLLSTAFSPEGSRMVTGSYDKTARVWDVAKGTELAVLRGHEHEVYSVAFSPDGTRILTGSGDKTARLWDATTGGELARFSGHFRDIYSVAFSPDGKRILTGSRDKTARLWDLATGRELMVFRGHTNEVHCVAFCSDGLRVATGSGDLTATVWDVSTGNKLHELRGHDGQVTSIAFNHDGTCILTGSWDKTARLWDAVAGKELVVLRGHEGAVASVAFGPDARILTGSWDNTVRIWDASSGRELTALHGHEREVTSVSFCREQMLIASSSVDHTARLWYVAAADEFGASPGHDLVATAAAFSPDGSSIATGSGEGVVRLWDAATGKRVAELHRQDDRPLMVRKRTSVQGGGAPGLAAHGDVVTSVSFSPDSTRLVTASWDKTVRLWDAATGKELFVLRGHDHEVYSASFSPDGTQILTASGDKTARLWDAVTGQELRALRGHNDRVTSASFSSDGAQIVTGSNDRTASIWDISTGKELTTFEHDDHVTSVAFSPDDKWVLTGSRDKTASLWDPATKKQLLVLRGHKGVVKCVVFNPDGTRILTASWDKTARLWDAVTGRELFVFRGHDRDVYSAAFSPDGTRVVTTAGTIRVWDNAPRSQRFQARQAALTAAQEAKQLVAELRAHLPNWSSIVSELHKMVGPMRQDGNLHAQVRTQAINLVLQYAEAEREMTRNWDEVSHLSWKPKVVSDAALESMVIDSLLAMARGSKVSIQKVVPAGSKSSWAPDGNRLVVAQSNGRGLIIVELDNASTRDLCSVGKDPAWSPDGRYIAYVAVEGGEEHVWLVDPDGGHARRIAGGGFPGWSSDGKMLYFRTYRKILQLRIDDPMARPTVYLDQCYSWYPAVSPDGTLVALGHQGKLIILDAAFGSTVATWSLPEGAQGLLPAWSPDGKRIAFGDLGGGASAGVGLWILPVSKRLGGAVRLLEGPCTAPAWSPDGKRLSFDFRPLEDTDSWAVWMLQVSLQIW